MSNEYISLAAGVIILKDNYILMVYEKGHWGLPKGSREVDESMAETAVREAKEETGLDVKLKDVAFVTEFKQKNHGYYIQVYYEAEVIGGQIEICDPDEEIEAVDYIHTKELRKHLTFVPRLLPLEDWLKSRTTGYHYFDLNQMDQFIP